MDIGVILVGAVAVFVVDLMIGLFTDAGEGLCGGVMEVEVWHPLLERSVQVGNVQFILEVGRRDNDWSYVRSLTYRPLVVR